MKLFQKLFEFYINSSIHVAFSVYSLLRITEIYFDLSYNENLDLFIFFGTIFGYNFTKNTNFKKLNYKKLSKEQQSIFRISLICIAGMLFSGIHLNIKTLLAFLPLGLLTLFYSSVLVSNKSLREIPKLKILIIAIVWSGATVFLPNFDLGNPISKTIILSSIQRLLFVIALTLPFDIRDFKQDSSSLETLPQLIGVKSTKKIGFILLAVILFIEFFISPNQEIKTVFLIIFLILLILLQRASINQQKYYSSFWVEAIPIFWWLILLLLK